MLQFLNINNLVPKDQKMLIHYDYYQKLQEMTQNRLESFKFKGANINKYCNASVCFKLTMIRFIQIVAHRLEFGSPRKTQIIEGIKRSVSHTSL